MLAEEHRARRDKFDVEGHEAEYRRKQDDREGGKAEVQTRHLESYIASGVDAIVLNPVDRMALGPASEMPASSPAAAGFSAGAPPKTIPIEPNEASAGVGNPSWNHVAYAEALREELDPTLVEAAHSLRSAVDLVYALALNDDPNVRKRQMTLNFSFKKVVHSISSS